MVSTVPPSTTYAKKSSSFPNMKNSLNLQTHRHSVGSVTLNNQLSSFAAPQTQQTYRQNGVSEFNDFKKQICENQPNNNNNNNNKISFYFQDFQFRPDVNSQKTDIDSSLENLCIQMMEHALGP